MKKSIRLLILFFVLTVSVYTCSGTISFADTRSVLTSETVYLGGYPIGINTLGVGLYVDDFASIKTDEGLINPLVDKGIERGDVLFSVNGNSVSSRQDVSSAIKPKQVNELVFIKNGKKYTVTTEPIYDKNTDSYLLGLYLSDSIVGLGTMTFVRKDGRFSALGHPIADRNGVVASVYDGKIYGAQIDGVIPSANKHPGRLSGDFVKTDVIGSVYRNTEYGVYGQMNDDSYKTVEIQTAQRITATAGKAKIYTTLKGSEPDYYDIEILSVSLQPKIKEKGILLRATDKRLLAIGGIVQGMSGSPIIQNGKLVGALTHVIVDDTTKGYGIYSDFLLDMSASY